MSKAFIQSTMRGNLNVNKFMYDDFIHITLRDLPEIVKYPLYVAWTYEEIDIGTKDQALDQENLNTIEKLWKVHWI